MKRILPEQWDLMGGDNYREKIINTFLSFLFNEGNEVDSKEFYNESRLLSKLIMLCDEYEKSDPRRKVQIRKEIISFFS